MPRVHGLTLAGRRGLEASKADVLACYRLLLGREPDPQGFAYYLQRVRAGLTRAQLVDEFLGSVEFGRKRGRERHGSVAEVVPTAEGFRAVVDPADFAVGHTVARTGVYEPEVTRQLRELLSLGQTFVDIGANMGWFSLLAAGIVGPSGRVVAVEPNPQNVALLARALLENGFGNVELLNIAAGAESGHAALETDGSNGRLILLDKPPPDAFAASFIVPVEPLDAALARAGVGRVDVMKIDVEGAEPLVVEGAAATIAAYKPAIVTEFYPAALDGAPWGGARAYLGSLRALGYRLSVIGAAGEVDDETALSVAGPLGHTDLLALPA